MARLDGDISNDLFEVLADFNTTLEHRHADAPEVSRWS
jgi:hypothetical protein